MGKKSDVPALARQVAQQGGCGANQQPLAFIMCKEAVIIPAAAPQPHTVRAGSQAGDQRQRAIPQMGGIKGRQGSGRFQNAIGPRLQVRSALVISTQAPSRPCVARQAAGHAAGACRSARACRRIVGGVRLVRHGGKGQNTVPACRQAGRADSRRAMAAPDGVQAPSGSCGGALACARASVFVITFTSRPL